MTEETRKILEEFARRVRARLGDRIKHIILYGSRARGDASPDSDYDVLVVVDKRTSEIRRAIIRIESEIEDEKGAFLVCLVRSESLYEENRRLEMPLYCNVEAEGVAF